jgi:hypothetical protein
MVVGLIMQCIRCGKIFASHTDGPEICWECYMKDIDNYMSANSPSNCDIPLPQGFGKQEGWICPVCGRGLAPWVDYCPCQSDWKITYGTATSLNDDGNSQSTVTSIDSEWNKYRTYTEGK